jgi:hypothetical protein
MVNPLKKSEIGKIMAEIQTNKTNDISGKSKTWNPSSLKRNHCSLPAMNNVAETYVLNKSPFLTLYYIKFCSPSILNLPSHPTPTIYA